jgi:hypothetical protein
MNAMQNSVDKCVGSMPVCCVHYGKKVASSLIQFAANYVTIRQLLHCICNIFPVLTSKWEIWTYLHEIFVS